MLELDMSFFISFNGQFKPYTPSNFIKDNEISPVMANQSIDKIHSNQTDNPKNRLLITQKIVHSYLNHTRSKNYSHDSIFARDLMSSPVYFHYVNDTYQEIFNSFTKFHYKHFPILNNQDILVGMVSDRDLLRFYNQQILIKDFMSTEVLTVRENARIQDIALVMLNENLGCTPVINENHAIIGLITKSNLLEFIIRKFHFEVMA